MFIRRAAAADLEVIAELRLQFLAEHRGIAADQLPEELGAATVDFLRRHDRSATIRSWLVEHDGEAVGVVSMLLLDLAPRPEDASGLEGYLINMYVVPPHRRQGLGRQLLAACRRDADELGLRRLLLHATPAGRSLYEQFGFEVNPNWMELAL